jgi:alpha-glucosidase
MHRYGGIWTGDNASWWSHLEQAIFMLPGLNMCGFYYIGSDTGGFGGSCTGEMLLRWLQLSAFTPLFRNHSAIGNRYQEPFSFEADTAVSSKKILRARYRLIPYLYSEYMNSVNNRTLFFSPLSFEFDNEMSRETEDQIFVGSACMIAPVYKANKKGRPVYLPQDMLEVDLTQDTFEGKIKRQGIHYLDYALDELKCWVRKDAMLPYVPTSRNVKHLDLSHLNVIAYVDKSAEYLLYDDDGTSYDYKVGHSTITKINIEKTEGDYLVKVENTHASIKTVSLKIYNSEGQITEKTMTL